MARANAPIDYAVPAVAGRSGGRARKRKRALSLTGASLVGLLVFGVRSGRFTSVSVCGGCGADEVTTEWEVPFTQFTYWRSHRIEQTPLSMVVARNGLAPAHAHTWLFVHGSGNGVACAIGTSARLAIAAHYPSIPEFIDAVAKYQGQAPAQKWTGALLSRNA